MSRQKLLRETHHDDALQAASLKAVDFARDQGRNILIGVGVLVAIVVGYALMESSRNSSNDAASSQHALALVDVDANNTDGAAQKLTDIVSRHGGSEAGKRARLYLGDIELKRGNAAAALGHFESFLKGTSSGDYFWTVGQRGKAVALENQSKFAEAAAAYEALAKGSMGADEQAKALIDAAQARLSAGDRPAAVALYDRVIKEFPTSRSIAAARQGKAELTAAG